MTNAPDARSLPARLGELSARLGRCPDLDTLTSAALSGLADLFGFEHSVLMLLDETGTRCYTIASHGYERAGIGSEVRVGKGLIGMAAAQAVPMRVGNLRQMLSYARSVRRAIEEKGETELGDEIPLPGLPDANSQAVAPAVVLGQLVGVLAIESPEPVAFSADDEALLGVVANLIASAIEIDAANERDAGAAEPGEGPARPSRPVPERAPRTTGTTRLRYFPVDGSTFLDDGYLIKGVAGRLLAKLVAHYLDDGRVDFSNREIRLDPSLELPAFRDNLESRLILLKRRLQEREAPIGIEKTGRGRFRLVVDGPVALETVS